jgi:hypothetical protein
MGQEQDQRRRVVAEAILAGEQVEEVPLVEWLTVLALVLAEFSGLSKDLVMGNRP